jgi:hypothetical protein
MFIEVEVPEVEKPVIINTQQICSIQYNRSGRLNSWLFDYQVVMGNGDVWRINTRDYYRITRLMGIEKEN